MIKFLLVGDTSVRLEIELKGNDAEFFVAPAVKQTFLTEAIESNPDIKVTHMGVESTLAEFPRTIEKLREYQVIMFTDVDSDAFQLYPDFMRTKVPLGPNRLKLVEQFVREGGAFIMGGGYATFSGRRCIGNYHHTPIESLLPVSIYPFDDRAEWPEGFHSKAVDQEHPCMKGLGWNEADFMFLGYNRTQLKPGATLLAEHEGEPIIAVWEYGGGRAMAFTPDPQPHWCGTFKDWEGYSRFWIQSILWLTKSGKR